MSGLYSVGVQVPPGAHRTTGKGPSPSGITSTLGTLQPALVYSIQLPGTPPQSTVPSSLKSSGSLRSYSYICFFWAQVAFLPGMRTVSVEVCTASGEADSVGSTDGDGTVVLEPPQAASASAAITTSSANAQATVLDDPQFP